MCWCIIILLPDQRLPEKGCRAHTCTNILEGGKPDLYYTCPKCHFSYCPNHFLTKLGFDRPKEQEDVMKLQQQLNNMGIAEAGRWARLAFRHSKSVSGAMNW